MHIKTIILFLISSSIFAAEQPNYPEWPRQFRATFTVYDSLEQPDQPLTSGTLDYNFDVRASKTTITSPQGGFTILMRPGKMYMTFSLDDTRCDVSEGVGAPYPDWLTRAQAHFDGIHNLNSRQANVWSYTLHSDSNRTDTFRYFEDTQTREPLRFEEETTQDSKSWVLRFDYTSFVAMPREAFLFDVPGFCR